MAPERSKQLLARGQEYGESRVVCAMHYPSDVAGGQLVATAIVARLHSVPQLSRDLACAKQEHLATIQSGAQISSECKTLANEMNGKGQQVQ